MKGCKSNWKKSKKFALVLAIRLIMLAIIQMRESNIEHHFQLMWYNDSQMVSSAKTSLCYPIIDSVCFPVPVCVCDQVNWMFTSWWYLVNEPHHEKTCLCHMRTTKAQIRLRIRAVWSAPLLFAAANLRSLISAFIVRCLDSIYDTSSCYIRNFKTQASLCPWAGVFESYLVTNPEDRFSCVAAQILSHEDVHLITDTFTWPYSTPHPTYLTKPHPMPYCLLESLFSGWLLVL